MNDLANDPALALRTLCQQIREEARQANVPETPDPFVRQQAHLIAAKILERQRQRARRKERT